MIRYPRPERAAKNSPMITPTRESPIFTFIMLKSNGIQLGMTAMVRQSFFVPPRVRMSVRRSLSTWRNPLYKFRILPKTAMEMAVIMIVFILFPSQTIRIGARADFGRLFKTTRYGSMILAAVGNHHKIVAISTENKVISAKLTSVSARVTPI